MILYRFIFMVVYVQNSEIHVLTFFFLSILFLTFIESILEKVNDVVCLLFLSNEGETEIVLREMRMIQLKPLFLLL